MSDFLEMLTDSERKIYESPFKNLTLEERLLAFQLRDRKTEWVKKQNEKFVPSKSANQKVYVISDDLGKDGILNHADGKMYDSKSQYYKAVKEAGCEVLGNDAPRESNAPQYKNHTEKDIQRDIAQSIQQLGG